MRSSALVIPCLAIVPAAYFAWVPQLARPLGPPPEEYISFPPAPADGWRQIGTTHYDRENDWAPRIILERGIVQVRFHSVSFPSADVPLTELVTAVSRYPTQGRFRVTWPWYGKDAFSKSTVLYDRRTHTVRFYCLGHDMGRFFKHAIYRGVSDTVLREDARSHERTDRLYPENRSEVVALAFFDALPGYGCAGSDLPPALSRNWQWFGGMWVIPA